MKPAKPGVDRRRFLIASSATVASVSIAGRFSAGCATTSTPAGPQTTNVTVAEIAVGASTVPSGSEFVIARDANGFFAYSNVCTHQGCALAAPGTSGVSTCPCHGAEFDTNGNNLAGPHGGAKIADLDHYRVSFSGTGDTATIVVDTSIVETDRSVRASPPA